MKVKTIYDDVFRSRATVIYECTILELNKQLKKIGAENVEDEGQDGVCLKDKYGELSIIWLRDIKDINSVAHETYHLVMDILDKRGIPIIKENDEVGAYLLGYYVEKICNLK